MVTDFAQWVRDRQRVITRNAQGVEQARGAVVAYRPAAVVVELDDGTQGSFPVEQVSATDESADAQRQTVLADVAVKSQGKGWDGFLTALRAAGYDVTTRPRGSGQRTGARDANQP